MLQDVDRGLSIK